MLSEPCFSYSTTSIGSFHFVKRNSWVSYEFVREGEFYWIKSRNEYPDLKAATTLSEHEDNLLELSYIWRSVKVTADSLGFVEQSPFDSSIAKSQEKLIEFYRLTVPEEEAKAAAVKDIERVFDLGTIQMDLFTSNAIPLGFVRDLDAGESQELDGGHLTLIGEQKQFEGYDCRTTKLVMVGVYMGKDLLIEHCYSEMFHFNVFTSVHVPHPNGEMRRSYRVRDITIIE